MTTQRLTGDRPMQPAPSAFICHASSDVAIADKIADRLEREGVATWVAPRSIRAGIPYADAIVQGIRDSASMVVLLTEDANRSSFVHREIERAASLSKHLILLRLDPVLPEKGLELFLSSIQWIEAHQIGIDRSLDVLKDALLGRDTVTSSASPRRPASHRRIWLSIALFVLVGAAAVASFPFLKSKTTTTSLVKEPLATAAAVREAARGGETDSVLALFSEQARGRQTRSRWQAIVAATRADLENAKGNAEVILQRSLPSRATMLGEGSFFVVQTQSRGGSGFLCEQVLLREEPERWAAEAYFYWLSSRGACVGQAELEAAAQRSHEVLSGIKASGEVAEDDRAQVLRLMAETESWRSFTANLAEMLSAWEPEPHLLSAIPLPGIQQGGGMPVLPGRVAQVRYAFDRQNSRAHLDLFMIQEADDAWRLAGAFLAPHTY
jgi:hypothetical protein